MRYHSFVYHKLRLDKNATSPNTTHSPTDFLSQPITEKGASTPDVFSGWLADISGQLIPVKVGRTMPGPIVYSEAFAIMLSAL